MRRTVCRGFREMKIDIERIQRYLAEIKNRHYEIGELLTRNTTDHRIRGDDHQSRRNKDLV
jgi:hypothetical protein